MCFGKEFKTYSDKDGFMKREIIKQGRQQIRNVADLIYDNSLLEKLHKYYSK